MIREQAGDREPPAYVLSADHAHENFGSSGLLITSVNCPTHPQSCGKSCVTAGRRSNLLINCSAASEPRVHEWRETVLPGIRGQNREISRNGGSGTDGMGNVILAVLKILRYSDDSREAMMGDHKEVALLAPNSGLNLSSDVHALVSVRKSSWRNLGDWIAMVAARGSSLTTNFGLLVSFRWLAMIMYYVTSH